MKKEQALQILDEKIKRADDVCEINQFNKEDQKSLEAIKIARDALKSIVDEEEFKESHPIYKLVMTFKGTDSFSRPVYEDSEGRLWKDVDPKRYMEPCLCSTDSFEGEPDTDIDDIERYNNVIISFDPERICW